MNQASLLLLLITFSIYVYVLQSKFNALASFTLVTIFLYFFAISHVLPALLAGLFPDTFIGTLHEISYDSVIKTQLCLSIFMVVNALYFYLVTPRYALRSPTRYLDLKPLSLKKSIFFKLILAVFCLSVLVYIVSAGTLPISEAITSSGDKASIYLARRNVKAEVAYYTYVMLGIRYFGTLSLALATLNVIATRKFSFLYWFILLSVVFANLLSFHRSPAIYMLLFTFLLFTIYKNNFKLYLSLPIVASLASALALLLVIQFIITHQSIDTAFSIILFRLIFGQSITLMSYFEVYPHIHSFVGLGFSNPLSVIFEFPLHIPAEEIFFALSGKYGERPIVYNTIGIGDFYAGLGFWGVLVYSFIIAIILDLTGRLFSSAPSSTFITGLFFVSSFTFIQFNNVNALIVLNSWGLGITILILIFSSFHSSNRKAVTSL